MIYKQLTFDAAHFLPHVPETHKCKNIHGHTYHLTIYVDGELDKNLGWIIDYSDLKEIIQPVIDKVDHHFLNEIPGLENPTCEIISIWLWNQIKPILPQLKRIELKETPTSGAIYEG
jgi:6-pyruvoyltetrahydropterin/6-carboxytetrahydropterin synthase